MKSDKPSWDQESEIISFCNLIKKRRKTRAPEKSHLKNVHRPFREKKTMNEDSVIKETWREKTEDLVPE